MQVSRRWLAAGLTLIAVALAAGSLLSNDRAPASASAAATSTSPATIAAGLSPAQLAGQRVVYSYSGLTPPARLFWLIAHGRAAGVVFFGENISGHAQIAAVIARFERANAASTNPVHAPLLLMTDQEGGRVRRLSGAPLLSEKEIGASNDPEAKARAAGRGAAHNLAGVGMNVNLAPVLDVYRSPGDFIDQYGRSYSSDANLVATLGGDFISAQQAAGVAATAKHFPGLGAARRAQNTDLGPVTLDVSATELRAVDELPYVRAIADRVRLVMVSWAVYPSLGSTRPAGLSAKIVKGELRTRLGFKAVTITDALEAGALSSFGTTAHRSILASRAGMDLLLCSKRRTAQGESAASALRAGYLDGTLQKADFKEAVARIIGLRQALAP